MSVVIDTGTVTVVHCDAMTEFTKSLATLGSPVLNTASVWDGLDLEYRFRVTGIMRIEGDAATCYFMGRVVSIGNVDIIDRDEPYIIGFVETATNDYDLTSRRAGNMRISEAPLVFDTAY